MPDTPEQVLNELESILDSIGIDPDPGCPKYAATCN